MINTNLTGLINMTQAVLAGMLKRGPDGVVRGDIINIGSIAGREPYQGGGIYCATKHAVKSFTGSLLRELVDTKVRVSEIQPGMVETEFSIIRFRGDKSKADKVYEGIQPRKQSCTLSYCGCLLTYLTQLLPRILQKRLSGLHRGRPTLTLLKSSFCL